MTNLFDEIHLVQELVSGVFRQKQEFLKAL